jgi:RNA polymerase sigma factor (sigma-70 family)
VTTGNQGNRRPLAEEERAHIEAARHDPRAFAPLYDAYVDIVWRYAMSRIGDRDRALDATGQTFARALAALPRFRLPPEGEEGAFRSWLMIIARNVVLDDLRQQRPTHSLDDTGLDAWLIDQQPLPEDLAMAAVEQQQVVAAIERLPPVQQRIVRLRLIGLKSAEIADILGMTVPAVDTAHFRAFARLRTLLAHVERY